MAPPTADSPDRPTTGRTTTLGLAILAAALGSCAPGGAADTPGTSRALLFTVDTLRSDYLGCYGAPPDWTPRIDAFAAESLRFEQAYSQATITNPSLTSMLTGLLPVQHGVHVQSSGYAPGILPAPVMLQGKGISTGSFIANMCKLQGVKGTVYSSGWDTTFCGMLDQEPDVREQFDWDRAVVEGGLEWIERQGGAWFCWMHLMDPHAEHRPDPAFWDYAADPVREKFEQYEYYNGFESRREQPGPEVIERLQALYVAQIRGVDERFGQVLDTLEERDDADDIAILFSADHGEELFETWTRYDHGLSMTEGVFQIPLIVRAPGLTPGVVQAPVELLAIAPTVLDLFGVDSPYPLAAPSLVSKNPSKGYAFSYGATITTSVRNANGRYWLRHTSEPYTRGEDESMAPWRAEAPWFQKKQNFAQYGTDGRTPEWMDVRRGEGARFAERAKVLLQSRHAEALELAKDFGEAVQIDDPQVAEMLKSLGYLEGE